MPRHEGNTARTRRRKHKKMSSGHHGKGGDRKLKDKKRTLQAERPGYRARPARKKKEPA